MAEQHSIVCIDYNFCIYLSFNGSLGCFSILAIVNSAAVKDGMHVSFSILLPSGYMPKGRIAGSYGDFFPSF